MARPPRIQYEDAAYHVFNRGNRRERIFRSENDYAAFEEILLESMPIQRLGMAELIARAASLSGWPPQALAGSSQKRRISRWRQALAHVAGGILRIPTREIAKAIGRDPTTVSHMLERCKDSDGRWPEIQQLKDLLDQ